MEVESFAHAGPQPVHAFIDDWEAKLKPHSDAVTHNRISLGVHRARWSWAYVQRYDYEIKASPDSALLYHQVRNRTEFTQGKEYLLDVRAFHQRSQGFRLAYRFGAPSLSVEAGVTLLQGQSLINGRIHGTAMAVGPKEYQYQASVRYHYSEDVLFDRPVRDPQGEGLSLDMRLRYRVSPTWTLSAQGEDLAGVLRWRKAPMTDAIASSDVQEFDENGFVRYRPTLTGYERNQSYRQRLHPRARVSISWDAMPRTRFGADWRLNEVDQYLSLSARRAVYHCWGTTLEWMPAFDAAGLGVDCGAFQLSLLGDSLRFDRAQLLQFRLSFAYAFGKRTSSAAVERTPQE